MAGYRCKTRNILCSVASEVLHKPKIQEEIAKEEPDLRLIEKLIVSDQSLTA